MSRAAGLANSMFSSSKQSKRNPRQTHEQKLLRRPQFAGPNPRARGSSSGSLLEGRDEREESTRFYVRARPSCFKLQKSGSCRWYR